MAAAMAAVVVEVAVTVTAEVCTITRNIRWTLLI